MSLLDPIKWNYLALGRQIETFSLVFLKLMLTRLCTDLFDVCEAGVRVGTRMLTRLCTDPF